MERDVDPQRPNFRRRFFSRPTRRTAFETLRARQDERIPRRRARRSGQSDAAAPHRVGPTDSLAARMERANDDQHTVDRRLDQPGAKTASCARRTATRSSTCCGGRSARACFARFARTDETWNRQRALAAAVLARRAGAARRSRPTPTSASTRASTSSRSTCRRARRCASRARRRRAPRHREALPRRGGHGRRARVGRRHRPGVAEGAPRLRAARGRRRAHADARPLPAIQGTRRARTRFSGAIPVRNV